MHTQNENDLVESDVCFYINESIHVKRIAESIQTANRNALTM